MATSDFPLTIKYFTTMKKTVFSLMAFMIISCATSKDILYFQDIDVAQEIITKAIKQ